MTCLSARSGDDLGSDPYQLLLAALGICTSMTVACKDCETEEPKTGLLDRIERKIELQGVLDAAQRAKLTEIANKCPVHRTPTSQEIRIETSEAPVSS